MGMKAGTYLGGIRTVEDLRCRCRVDELSGCWHWGLAIVQGVPSVHFMDSEGVRHKTRGRRAALLLSGRRILKGQLAYATKHCQSTDCVNPDHCLIGNRHAAGKALSLSGVWKNHPRKIAAARATAASRRKLDDVALAEIRSSTESIAKLAKKLNVSKYAVWAARVGKTGRGTTASVFNWRPA